MSFFRFRSRAAAVPRCELCGAPIEAGERYFELPDGMQVCADSDCLCDWAVLYCRTRPQTGDEEDFR